MKRAVMAALPLVILSGCATVFTGTSDNVTFKSVPDGAKVEVNGNSMGRTPLTIPMQRSMSPPQVVYKLDGYDSRNVMLQNSFNGVSIINVLFWPGFIVDAATGSMMKYDMLTYEAELDREKRVSSTN